MGEEGDLQCCSIGDMDVAKKLSDGARARTVCYFFFISFLLFLCLFYLFCCIFIGFYFGCYFCYFIKKNWML